MRVKENPKRWIVDEFYDILNTKINEDILYWEVRDMKEESKRNQHKSKEEKKQ